MCDEPWQALVAIVVGAYMAFSIKVADQWQKAAVLHMGRYIGAEGLLQCRLLTASEEKSWRGSSITDR